MSNLKNLNKIAVPLIFQSVSGLIIGMLDQIMIGKISVFAYSAVGVVFNLLYLIAGVLGVISVAFNIKGSKAIGKNDKDSFSNEFYASLLLDIIVGILFFTIIVLFSQKILKLFYDFKGDILIEANKYFLVMSSYILIQLLIFSFAAVLKMNRKTNKILIVSTFTAFLDLILNYILIYGKFGLPAMGVSGAGLSTIISSLINLFIYISLERQLLHFHVSKVLVYFKTMINNLEMILSLIGQEIIECFVLGFFINIVLTRLGLISLTTYLILEQIMSITFMPMYMYGSATMILASESIGAGDTNNLKDIVYQAIKVSLIIYLVFSIIYFIFRNYIPAIIISDKEIIYNSSKFIPLVIIIYIFRPIQTIYKYTLQSLEKAGLVFITTTIINAVYLLIIFILYYLNFINLVYIYVGIMICDFTLLVFYRINLKKLYANKSI